MKVKSYKKEIVIKNLQNSTVYKVQKDGRFYIMHQFKVLNQNDQHTFKVRKRLQCSNIVKILDEFEENNKKYYISQYIETNLLKIIQNHNQKVLHLKQALSYVSQIIEVIGLMHSQKLLYRNLRPQKILIKDKQPYFYDFTVSQFRKRKQRMFDIVGSSHYLAPECFSDDGYGQEVDIWAVGVLLYFLIVHSYPFQFKGEQQDAYHEQFKLKCSQGFKFSKQLQKTHFSNSYLKGNQHLQDFFQRIFNLNPTKRINIQGIKAHPLFFEHVSQRIDKQILSVIQENCTQESLFLSKLYNFSCSKILHKQQIILDFIQQTAQLFLLECPQIYSEQLRYRTQFAIVKVALYKVTMLLDVLFGIREPLFKVDQKQWKQVRSSTSLVLIKQKLERKKKILIMIFKNACMNVKQSIEKQPDFFNQKIPYNFQEIKLLYRTVLLQMYETGRKSISKLKGNRKLVRKITESMVRVLILFLVNRLFESEQQINLDFNYYLNWSKKKDLQDLQQWIQTEQTSKLRDFMRSVKAKYL